MPSTAQAQKGDDDHHHRTPRAATRHRRVDTHLDLHVASAKDASAAAWTPSASPPPPPATGPARLGPGLGEVQAWGVEGTGCYGAALARFLRSCGQVVVEVNRPDRAARRRRGKSDPLDAEAAARAVQAGEATTLPKAGNGTVEMLRSLRVARQSAIKARTQAINALKALIVTAPADLREQLRGHSAATLVRTAAGLQPGKLDDPRPPPSSRCAAWPSAIRRLTPKSPRSTASSTGWSPRSPLAWLPLRGRSRLGWGAAGGSRGQPGSAALGGRVLDAGWSSPLEASSGKTRRHRLNRGGDRQANAALYRIVIVRLRWHQPTKDYLARRLTEATPRRRSSAA